MLFDILNTVPLERSPHFLCCVYFSFCHFTVPVVVIVLLLRGERLSLEIVMAAEGINSKKYLVKGLGLLLQLK